VLAGKAREREVEKEGERWLAHPLWEPPGTTNQADWLHSQ